EIGCVVPREDTDEPCGRYGQPVEYEDGRIIQACYSCRDSLGPIRLIHSNYPRQVTPDDVRAFALKRIREYLEIPHITTADDIVRSCEYHCGGSGGSRREHPSYRWQMGTPVKRGYIEVELEGEGDPVALTFKISDLVAEAKTGLTQLALLGDLPS